MTCLMMRTSFCSENSKIRLSRDRAVRAITLKDGIVKTSELALSVVVLSSELMPKENVLMIDFEQTAKDLIAWQVIHNTGNLAKTMAAHIADTLRHTYERGRKDENEACAKLAEEEGFEAYEHGPDAPVLIRKRMLPNASAPNKSEEKK